MRRVGTILLRNVKCETNGSLHVEWSNGHTHKYLPQWLLDHDPSCFHPTSLQRQKDSATLPRSAKTQQAHIENSGSSLRVEIDDGSKIVFDSEWLRTLSQKPAIPEKELWDSASFPSVVKCQASDLATKDEVLLNCLDSLYRYGIAVVSNTPSRSDEFEQLVRRIGKLLLYRHIYILTLSRRSQRNIVWVYMGHCSQEVGNGERHSLH